MDIPDARFLGSARTGKVRLIARGCTVIRKTGFTLIELLIVVAIIGILAAIAVPNFLNAQLRAKISKAEADLRTLATAMETYRLDNTGYPPYNLWGGHSHPRYLNALSTPVAYLTSPESVDDPFGLFEDHDGVRGQRFGYNIINNKNVPLSWIVAPKSGFEPIWKGVRLPGPYVWILRSRGPNKKMNSAPDDPTAVPNGVFLVYQSSNGLISSGDIYRLGP